MARDGSGTYTRVEGPYVNGNVADADEMNNELDDIADAITDSINNAGTKAFGANQSMGGFRLTDLAAPSSANDAARKAYVDSTIASSSQPLDATLTALAALSYTSGTLYLTMTASDTFALANDAGLVKTTGAQTVGGAKTFTSIATINLNAGSLPAPLTGVLLHMGQADGTSTRAQWDAFASDNQMTFRRAQGTAASPSALQSGNAIANFVALGYGATGYSSTSRGDFGLVAAENWTDSAQGTYGRLRSNSLGAATVTERYRWGDFTSTLELGYRDGGPGSVPDTSYTFALTDRGTATDHSSGSAHTYTVPPNSSVAWPANSILLGTNTGAGALTIGRGSGVTFRNAAGTNADLTVPQYGMYMLRRVSSDVWYARVY